MRSFWPVMMLCCSLVVGCAQVTPAPQVQGKTPSTQRNVSTLSAELTAPLYDEPAQLRAHVLDPIRQTGTERARTESIQHRDNERRSPPFIVTDSHGMSISSDVVFGTTPIAIVFFASWCELCATKIQMIRRALHKTGEVKTLWVAVDSEDTARDVPGFMREQRLADEAYIVASDHPDFSAGYNPISSIPLVVVIGKSGELVDYQIGVQPDDGPRLEQALVSAALR